MQTHIYLIRHAEINYTPDDYSRPLSEKGKADAAILAERFTDFHVSKVISSPYLRAVDTVKGIAEKKGFAIEIMEDFRERKVADCFLTNEEFHKFAENQWNDFNYRLDGGESLNQTQERGIAAIHTLLDKYSGEDIVVGTHGTILGVILHYYDKKYDYQYWKTLKMPDVFKLAFNGKKLQEIVNIDFGFK